ncbi:RRP42 [Candida oxycetoniae]|uniref:Ribosomal RNA-processing protein 42 n=1 Tax=Candida oxycetoniae TaxID=497107 RepID=A0AAI9WZ10_9ASCO|nr:RRP42 [Candida oxycetoniae]KAI3405574.2 RRP42 [Candida oxycetoniae]
MLLSPAERQYLYDSLSQSPIIRPDSRSEHQFRPLEATTSFLLGSNGSARIRLSDGSESIISIKSKVISFDTKTMPPHLIEIDIDIIGYRDDSNYVANLKFQLCNLLEQNFPIEVLKLTSRYTFKLFIDCIVISHSSYPLSLISFGTYLALKTMRLPLLVSDVHDEKVAELPTFSDDWGNARLLEDILEEKGVSHDFQPPILITVGVIGNNLIFDPSVEEEQVLENGLIVSFSNGKVITPIVNANFSSNNNLKGLNKALIVRSLSMCNKYCPAIIKALDTLVEQDGDNNEESIF